MKTHNKEILRSIHNHPFSLGGNAKGPSVSDYMSFFNQHDKIDGVMFVLIDRGGAYKISPTSEPPDQIDEELIFKPGKIRKGDLERELAWRDIDIGLLWEDLVNNGYIDESGIIIQEKFNQVRHKKGMELDNFHWGKTSMADFETIATEWNLDVSEIWKNLISFGFINQDGYITEKFDTGSINDLLNWGPYHRNYYLRSDLNGMLSQKYKTDIEDIKRELEDSLRRVGQFELTETTRVWLYDQGTNRWAQVDFVTETKYQSLLAKWGVKLFTDSSVDWLATITKEIPTEASL